MKILLTRHGRTFDNEFDPELTKEGKIQVKKLTKKLKKYKINKIYSSDLKRALQTAYPISKTLNLEINKRKILREFRNEVVDAPRSKWIHKKENLSRIEEMKKFLVELNKKHKNNTILIIAHANTNRVISSILTKVDLHKLMFFMQGHCNITIIEFGEKINPYITKKGWKVILWNSLEHIPLNLRSSRNVER